MTILEKHWDMQYIGPKIDWPMVDIEFAPNEYQFIDAGTAENAEYNEVMFMSVNKSMVKVFNNLFPDPDSDIEVVVNIELTEDSVNNDVPVPELTMFGELAKSVSHTEIVEGPATGLEEKVTAKQFFYTTKAKNILASDIFVATMNKDFPDRMPQWFKHNNVAYWHVYFVSEDIIYFPYDDRGANIIFKSIEKKKQYMTENPDNFYL